MIIFAVAFFWAFLEATVFFIVPDVFLSLVGIGRLKKSLIACVIAALGAVLGGALLYLFAAVHFDEISKFYNHIPAISPHLQQTVESQLKLNGIWAVFFGPIQGIPFKLYILYAAELKLPLWVLLVVSFPARLIRFVLVTLAVHWISKSLLRFMPLRLVYALTVILWCLFYGFYFTLME